MLSQLRLSTQTIFSHSQKPTSVMVFAVISGREVYDLKFAGKYYWEEMGRNFP